MSCLSVLDIGPFLQLLSQFHDRAKDTTAIYQLGMKHRYIGKCQLHRKTGIIAGGTARYREHSNSFEKSTCSKSASSIQDFSRYQTLGKDNEKFLFIIFIQTVSSTLDNFYEAAFINFAKPDANYVPKDIAENTIKSVRKFKKQHCFWCHGQ